MMDKVFKMGVLVSLFAVAAALFESSQNGRYQYSRSDVHVVIDTRTGEFWTEDGTHFIPRAAQITVHHPAVDDQSASDDSANKFRECLDDVVRHHSGRNCLAEQQAASPTPDQAQRK